MIYAQRMQTYLDLWRRYSQRPSGAAQSPGLEQALTAAEHEVLDHAPPGKVKGLRPGPLLPATRARDRLDEIIPINQWLDRLVEQDSVRMRPFVSDILDQDGVGSCASEGICGAVMCRRALQGLPPVTLNPWAVYHTTSGGVDRGSTLSANLKFLMDYGAPSQHVWPRSKGWQATPSSAAMLNAKRHKLLEVVNVASKEEFGSCLILGIPVYFGYPGHAIFAVDLIDTDRFRYANSWDESWGDSGFGTLRFSSVEWGYGTYGILSVTGPDDEV